ncbi:MAG: phosphate acyltransferase PlsX [Deltaproteobacteria bacterium]|nr:phosphate acyltransferase PlsX [Deltaproteobacteria bacterium]
MRIAVDAMGGDNAPECVVDGAVLAAKEHGIHVILVGDRELLKHQIKRRKAQDLSISIKHASEVVEMHEHPSVAVRRKKDSSIRVAYELVKAGEAVAAVSAGNSGAAMALGMLVLRLLPGVERPAIATVMPNLHGSTVVLDVGANVDCKPIHLVHFALMGEVFARHVLKVENPRVGVLSNGEEASKGTELTRATDEALRKSSVNYIGYVEGRDIFLGNTDVIVCDGFTGNAVLKASEGCAMAISQLLREELNRSLIRKLGAFLAQGAFKAVKRRTDYKEIGGAPLLGINGIGIIAHGSSDAQAIKNAIRNARDLAEERVNLHVMHALEKNQDLENWASRKAKTAKSLWSHLKEKIIHHRPEEPEETED